MMKDDAISRAEVVTHLEFCLANYTDYKKALEETLDKVKNVRGVETRYIDKIKAEIYKSMDFLDEILGLKLSEHPTTEEMKQFIARHEKALNQRNTLVQVLDIINDCTKEEKK